MSIRKAERPAVRDYGRNIRDLVEFACAEWECAEVELDGRDPMNVYRALRDAINRKGIEGIRAVKSGEHVFLVREADE